MAEFQEVMHRYVRMCENSRCNTCPLQKTAEGIYEGQCRVNYDCLRFLKEYPEAAEKTINDWAEANPVKTYKSEFMKAFPECDFALVKSRVCPKGIFGFGPNVDNEVDCGEKCDLCWNKEMKNE